MRRSKKKWIIDVEGVLIYLLSLCMIVLLLSQILLLKEGTRFYLSKVDQMEGESLSLDMPLYADTPLQITEETTVGTDYQHLLRKSKVIVIKMIKGSNGSAIFILVNGKKVDDFRKNNSKLTVYDGDYVEIDGRSSSQPLQFVINIPDQGFLSPPNGLILEGENQIFTIGKIKFKSE
ncbi:hypothetical protein [Pelosinus sp. sgz500959]|uniref:hypothetical protein n=1 Tax=Pelosinus sp. sgz500959 TaxID=3242472 RepID=UPI00366FF526